MTKIYLKHEKEYFSITSICRADLVGMGFDAEHLDDDMMTELADRMENAYLEQNYWTDLDIIASDMKIKKIKR